MPTLQTNSGPTLAKHWSLCWYNLGQRRRCDVGFCKKMPTLVANIGQMLQTNHIGWLPMLTQFFANVIPTEAQGLPNVLQQHGMLSNNIHTIMYQHYKPIVNQHWSNLSCQPRMLSYDFNQASTNIVNRQWTNIVQSSNNQLIICITTSTSTLL